MRRRKASKIYSVDPHHPLPPEDFPAPAPGTGEVIALLAEEGPRAHGWPARFAAELAARWSAEGLPVLLVDGDLSGASLHEHVNQENDEGVTDLIFFGASRERVMREVADGGHLFVPSGTVVADPESAYKDPRWSVLLSEAKDSGSVLLLFLPEESAAVSELVAEAQRVIRFTWDPPEGAVDGDSVVVYSSAGEVPLSSGPGIRSGSRASADTTATREGDTGVAAVAPAAGDESKGRKTKESKRSRVPILLLVLFLVIAVGLGLAWFGYVTIPGLPFGPSSSSVGPDPLIRLAGN